MISNPILAEALAELTNPIPKCCWKNSLDALLALRYHDKSKAEDARYVEGHLVICNGALPIAHGWLEVDGRIVDVTLPFEYPPEMYYPVFYYTLKEITLEISLHNMMPLHENTHEGRAKMYEAWVALPQNEPIRALLENFKMKQEMSHEN